MNIRFIPMLVAFRVMLLASVTSAAQNEYEHESWPHEGMPYFVIVKDAFDLHETTSSSASIVMKLKVEKGSVVSFDFGVKELLKRRKQHGAIYGIQSNATINDDLILGKSIQKTIKPGVIRAASSGAIMGTLYDKGDVIENLLYLGEGVCLYRYKGSVFENETCLYSDIQDGSLVQESQPIAEWWVSVIKSGKTLGWLKIDDKSPLKLIETIK